MVGLGLVLGLELAEGLGLGLGLVLGMALGLGGVERASAADVAAESLPTSRYISLPISRYFSLYLPVPPRLTSRLRALAMRA